MSVIAIRLFWGTISLPTGASTSALQTAGNASLATVATNSGTEATAALQTAGNNSLATLATASAGQATAANQATGNASLATLATASATQATAAGQTAMTSAVTALGTTITSTAAPTSVPGTSIASTVAVPGLQGVTGGVAMDGVVKGTGTDIGGTIAAGGTAQQLMAANPLRRGYHIENQSSGPLYVNCSGTATLDFHSLLIPAGQEYESSTVFTGPGACSIVGATTAQAFYGRQF